MPLKKVTIESLLPSFANKKLPEFLLKFLNDYFLIIPFIYAKDKINAETLLVHLLDQLYEGVCTGSYFYELAEAWGHAGISDQEKFMMLGLNDWMKKQEKGKSEKQRWEDEGAARLFLRLSYFNFVNNGKGVKRPEFFTFRNNRVTTCEDAIEQVKAYGEGLSLSTEVFNERVSIEYVSFLRNYDVEDFMEISFIAVEHCEYVYNNYVRGK